LCRRELQEFKYHSNLDGTKNKVDELIMDPDEERKRKAREKMRKYRDKEGVRERLNEQQRKRNAKLAIEDQAHHLELKKRKNERAKADSVIKQRESRQRKIERIQNEKDPVVKARLLEEKREKQAERMRNYRANKKTRVQTMTHHGAKPLAPRGVGIPTDAEDLMGNFVFPVQSESDKDEEDFYLPSDEEPDDFFHHHDFGPGSGGAGMAMA
jgi:hypothetical protein